ncbi:O-antigen ligase family protein [Chitinophaga polysaccharea]|uniref:O-antigen ligase family protein n=1 Tax=Chitinophaga polysaccharea TaxID=1293035 RepID=UPI0016463D22|nr:O-antigen ligase family protein [Chitinophaga polysaccharea]
MVGILTVLGTLLYYAERTVLVFLFCYGNFAFLIYELSVAGIQISNEDPIKGTLLNTGVFTIYLMSTIPLLFYFIIGKNSVSVSRILSVGIAYLVGISIRIFCVFVLVFIIYIFIQSQSRTAQIAIAIITLLSLWKYNQNYAKTRWKLPFQKMLLVAIPITLISISLITYYTLSIKKGSTNGRLLMNKVAFDHITDHFWTGTGIGAFTKYYPEWQAAYFRSTPNPPHFFLLSAGESYIVFNEYLQLFETVGIFGTIILGIFLIRFLRTKSAKDSDLLHIAKLTVISILSCGFTSYPFHINITLFVLMLSICIAFKFDENKSTPLFFNTFQIKNKKISYAILTICLIASLYLTIQTGRQYQAISEWKKTGTDNGLPRSEQQSIYENIYPLLKKDGKFLTEYGIFLSQDSLEKNKAIVILKQAKGQFMSKATMEALGNAYWKTKDYNNAIECYKWVSDYIPSLFTPRFNLLKLYLQSGNITEALKTGNTIITMSPKIPSDEVDNIKQETRQMLEKYN